MERNISLDEISDGKLYTLNDMVKVGCNDCKGCSACCQGMGKSIILDPLDIYRLVAERNNTFEELLIDKIELNIVDGIIMPNLKMTGLSEKCAFLNEDGRCSIHTYRPGICRLFPLGRYYEEQSYKYFLQIHECKQRKIKIKVRKWIDTPDIRTNKQFVIDWHFFFKDLQEIIKTIQDDKMIKDINMYLLKTFYITPYDKNIDFYSQFHLRLKEAKEYKLRIESVI